MEIKEVDDLLTKYRDLDDEYKLLTGFIENFDAGVQTHISYKYFGEYTFIIRDSFKEDILKLLNERAITITDEKEKIIKTFESVKEVK